MLLTAYLTIAASILAVVVAMVLQGGHLLLTAPSLVAHFQSTAATIGGSIRTLLLTLRVLHTVPLCFVLAMHVSTRTTTDAAFTQRMFVLARPQRLAAALGVAAAMTMVFDTLVGLWSWLPQSRGSHVLTALLAFTPLVAVLAAYLAGSLLRAMHLVHATVHAFVPRAPLEEHGGNAAVKTAQLRTTLLFPDGSRVPEDDAAVWPVWFGAQPRRRGAAPPLLAVHPGEWAVPQE